MPLNVFSIPNFVQYFYLQGQFFKVRISIMYIGTYLCEYLRNVTKPQNVHRHFDTVGIE
jgi:hypothetical protein